MDMDERIDWLEGQEVKNCPFCGHVLPKDDPDTLYPLATRENGAINIYAWNIVCSVTAGGCDASMLGDSPGDCLAKWNKRACR